ncbi:MAG: DUF5522 domain-containing protein [Silvibacterium sp.]
MRLWSRTLERSRPFRQDCCHFLRLLRVVRLPDDSQPLVEGVDYVMEGPYMVLTAAYHLNRGYCCESGCRNCPWRVKEGSEDERS